MGRGCVRGGMLSRKIVTMYIHFYLHVHVFSSVVGMMISVYDILHTSIITQTEWSRSINGSS